MVGVIPVPCAAVLIGINHREDVEGLGLGQISAIGNVERDNKFHGHNLALVAGALLVISHSVILVSAHGQVVTIVNPSQGSTGSHVLEGVDNLAVTHELNLFQIGGQGLSVALHCRSREVDGHLELLLGLYSSQVGRGSRCLQLIEVNHHIIHKELVHVSE